MQNMDLSFGDCCLSLIFHDVVFPRGIVEGKNFLNGNLFLLITFNYDKEGNLKGFFSLCMFGCIVKVLYEISVVFLFVVLIKFPSVFQSIADICVG